jgi:hypothetical protein
MMDELKLGYDARKGRACSRPTAANPFMNVLLTDFKENPHRAPACDVRDCGTRSEVHQLFNKNLQRDVGDIFYKNASDREFYSTPNTTIPNDQDAFAKWLYKTPPEKGLSCWRGRPHGD